MEQLQLELAVVQSKICSKCKIEKDIKDFYKNKSNKDGINGTCIPCVLSRVKSYRENNLEKCKKLAKRYNGKYKEGKKLWAQSNKDKVATSSLNWKKKNPDKVKAIAKRWRDGNKETIQNNNKEYREKNKDKVTALNSQWRDKNKDRMRITDAAWKANNKDRIQATSKMYRENNKELIQHKNREWKIFNKDKVIAHNQNRRSMRKKAEGKYTSKDIDILYLRQEGLCVGCSKYLARFSKSRFHVDHIIPLSKGGSNWPANLQLLCKECNLSKFNHDMEEWMDKKCG